MKQIHIKNSSSLIDRLIQWVGFLLLITSTSLPSAESTPICYGKIDLIFIIDASYSITDPNFQIVRNFTSKLYTKILTDIGENLRVGIVPYASRVYPEQDVIHLIESQTEVIPKLLTFQRDPTNIKTNTGTALEYALQMFNTEGDPQAIKIAILITDGKADDPATVSLVAAQFAAKGIVTLAVGIGTNESVSSAELTTIATDPSYVYIQTTITEELLIRMEMDICGKTLDKKIDPIVPKSAVPMHIYFLLDETMPTQDFDISKNFVKKIIQTFVISSTEALVSVIKYGVSALDNHLFKIGTYLSEADTLRAIDAMTLNTFNSGVRNLTQVFIKLDTLIKETWSASNPVPIIVVVIASGPASNTQQAIARANAFRDSANPFVYLVVLGIGTDSTAWEGERNQLSYDVGTAFHTSNIIGITGNDQTSVTFIKNVRNVIYELAVGTYQPTGFSRRLNYMVDIVFAVDGSGAMQKIGPSFALIKFVIKTLADKIQLGSDKGRVAVMLFDAAGVYNILHFGTYNDNHTQLNALIDGLSLISRTAVVDNSVGLDAMRQYFLNNNRESANKLGYLITFGRAENQLLAEAEARAIAMQGIQLIEIGIGNDVNITELNGYQMFEPNDGPVLLTPIFSITSTATLNELEADLVKYGDLSRPRGRYFPWTGAFDFIVLVHDESGRKDGGESARQFMMDLFQRYEIGLSQVQVGVITFGAAVNTGTGKEILLGSDFFISSLIAKTYGLQLIPTGGPNVLAALDAMLAMFGTRGRANINKVALLIMQGDVVIDDVLQAKIRQVRNAGVAVMSLGIGPETDIIDLKSFSYNSEEGLAFIQNSWQMAEITPRMDAGIVALSRGQFQASATDSILRLPTQCNGTDAAIVFALDASDSITDIFDDVKSFTAVLMSGFVMPYVKMGAFAFASQVLSPSIQIGEFETYVELYIQFMDRIKINPNYKLTSTDLAIKRITDMFIGTPYTEKVGIILTDGKSQNRFETVSRAIEARNSGIKLLTIGIGDSIDLDELSNITGDLGLVFLFKQQGSLTNSTELLKVQEVLCKFIRKGECLAGSYRDPTNLECKVCPVGTYQSLSEELFCFPCGPGLTTLTNGTTTNTQCIIDCNAGFYNNGLQCLKCAVGTYQPESGKTSCISCPTDKPVTRFEGSTSLTDCMSRVCETPMDLVMVVDSTASIGVLQFNLLKVFLIAQLDKFQIGAGVADTRISVVRIGEVTLEADATTFLTSKTEVVAAIRNLVGGDLSTNTASALEMASKRLKDLARPNIARVIFIVTDGISRNTFETKYQALLAKQRNYKIVVLGIGSNYYLDELRGIASVPQEVMVQENYYLLPYFDAYTAICAAAKTWQPEIVQPIGRCDLALDLILVMDQSASFSAIDLQVMKVTLINFVFLLEVAATKVNIGVVSFGLQVNLADRLPLSYDRTAIDNSIRTQPMAGYGTVTDQALLAARQMLNSSSRANAAKAMLIITDGRSANYTATAAAAAQVQKDNIYAVVVGTGTAIFEKELKAISTTGSDTVIIVDKIGSLSTTDLETKVCPEKFKCSYSLHVAYIWYLSNDVNVLVKAQKFSADVSDRFVSVQASVIEVKSGTAVDTLLKAMVAAETQMSAETMFNTIHNVVIITDKKVSDILNASALLNKTNQMKNDGTKITIINAGTETTGNWTPYASSVETVFTGGDFSDKVPAWYIYRSLCKEPCDNGLEIKPDGICGECRIGYYRNKTSSYMCQQCPKDATTNTTGSVTVQECNLSMCEVPMDLIFVIDATASIGVTNFGYLKSFFWNLVERFPVGVGVNNTRIAVVRIGEQVGPGDFSLLSDSYNKTRVQISIVNLRGEEQITNTAASIEKMVDIFRTDGRDQKKYPHIALVATDGKSNNTFQTNRFSSIAKLNGINTQVIALGDGVFMPEIQALAYDLNSIYNFSTFQALYQSNFIHDVICNAARNYKPIVDVVDPADKLLGQCKSFMDVVFLMDASAGVTMITFQNMKNFILQYAQELDIGSDKIRIGIVAFSNTVHSTDVFSLQQCTSLSVLETAGIQPQAVNSAATTSDLSAALVRMNAMFDSQGRPNTAFVGILLTAATSDNTPNAVYHALVARQKGIHMVSIGFGNRISPSELLGVATDPDSFKAYAKFEDLAVEDLIQMSCAAQFTCPYPMSIIAIWDIINFDSFISREKFITDLSNNSFTASNLRNIDIDHLVDAANGMQEALWAMTNGSATPINAQRIIVLMTDKPQDATVKATLLAAANTAKANGVLVAVVDTTTPLNNIADVASNGKLYYTTDKFATLPYNFVLKRTLCTAPCPGGYERDSTGNCVKCAVDMYRNPIETFVCVDCPVGRKTYGGVAARLDDCLFGNCLYPMDVVFVIDSSLSIRPFEFSLMKAFLHNTISSMDIGQQRTRVGLVPYTSDILAPLVFELQESTSQAVTLAAVSELNQGNLITGTNTARAIDVANNMLLAQGRETGGVAFLIVVITDGRSDNSYRTAEESRKAQANYIRMYSLGVGPNIYMDELYRIASDAASVTYLDSFMKLAQLTNFTKIVCEDTFTCDKKVDLVIFEDNTPTSAADVGFRTRVNSFATKMAVSYGSASITRVPYTSMTDLNTKIQSQNLATNPQNTRIFLFVTKTDLANLAVLTSIDTQLRTKGGIVGIINGNPALDSTIFVTKVSSPEYLFKVEKFDDMPWYRYIERKMCIAPCPDGEQRRTDGKCELCPIGTYRVRTDSRQCTTCPAGKTTQNLGSTLAVNCIPNCGPGTYTTTFDTCELCPLNTYQPLSFQSSCTPCPSGFVTVATGSTLLSQCVKNCPAGQKRTLDNQNCLPCEKDTYQSQPAQTDCIACPINLFTSTTGANSEDLCLDTCGVPMDIIFLVDASISLTNMEFTLIKLFLDNSINRFKVGPAFTRIGLVQFADIVPTSPRLDLVDSVDRDTAREMARFLIHSTQPGTNTAEAFRVATTMFRTQGRPNVYWNIVVITDGQSDNTAATSNAATEAKKNFIHITSIGVGNNFYLKELQSIATDESAVKTFTSFYSLVSYNILPTICTATQFQCNKSMDIFYIKHYSNNAAVETKVQSFLTALSRTYTQVTTTQINSGTGLLTNDINQLTTTLAGNPATTKTLIIFTNKPTTEPSVQAAAAALRDKGVIVAVVYSIDAQTDTSFDNVVSKTDLLFYEQDFDGPRYRDFILRSLCIAPCGDGSERTPTGDCALCVKGTYRTASASQKCLDCPMTPRPTTTSGPGAVTLSECRECSGTQWPCANGAGCIDETKRCDNTRDCADGSDEICNNCVKGTRWDGTRCIPCPKGTYQPNNKAEQCLQCPDGSTTTVASGAVNLTQCDFKCNNSGQEIDYPNQVCKNCSVGYYRNNATDGICVKCPDKFTTVLSGAVSLDKCVPNCPAGQYWNDIAQACQQCLVNTYQPLQYQRKCEPCPNGTTTGATAGATSVTQCIEVCPVGKELPPGGKSLADCVNCTAGTYKSSSNVTCQPCPAGYTTVSTGSTNSAACVPDCNKGQYWNEALKKCEECKFGEYQPNKYQRSCIECEPGKTTDFEGSDDITDCYVPCPAGYILPYRINGTCTPCPKGSYRVNDPQQVNCTQCGTGLTTEQEASTNPTDCKRNCPPGSKIVAGACVLCEIGSYQSLPLQTSCTPCAPYTTTLTQGNISPNNCTDPCRSGQQLVSQNPIQCENCAKNTYKQAGVYKNCVPCPTNHITLSTAAISKSDCLPNCNPGSKWNAVTGQCELCEIGAFQPQYYQSTCIKCRLGWVTASLGATIEEECFPNCPPGTSWSDTVLACVACPRDKYQPLPYQMSCQPCENGTLTANPGATSPTQCTKACPEGKELKSGSTTPADCVDCKIGYYKPSTDLTCRKCLPEGYITLSTGSVSSASCIPPCNEGTHWSSQLGACIECQIGQYQDVKYQLSCKQCTPAGYTTLLSGSKALTDCVPPCQLGTAWNSAMGQCKPCVKGQYQDQTNQATCKLCPAGQTTLAEGSYRATDCYTPVCTPDQWQCVSGTCIPLTGRCDGVNNCPDQSDESTSICCPIGQFYNQSSSRCENCPVGKYQDAPGRTACIPCAKGFVTPTSGSDSVTDCIECPAGSQFLAGATACTPCPVNTYREPGMMECQRCPLDFITTTTGSKLLTDCKARCVVGQYYNAVTFKCEPCKVGWYQNEPNQLQCKKCSPGLTTLTNGSTSASQCIEICAPGETLIYDIEGEPTTTCRKCPIGTIKYTMHTCIPCAAGFSTVAEGSTQCVPTCRPGYYYPDVTVSSCIPCAKGTYQSEFYQSFCITCPPGKTTASTASTSVLLCYNPCGNGYDYNSTTDSCYPCPKGTYRKQGVNDACKPCDPGYNTLTTGAVTDAECLPDCPKGSYFNMALKQCQLCPRNMYQPNPYKYTCIPCPAGTSVNVLGSDELVDCQDPCPANQELQPTGSCALCPVGTTKIPPSTVCNNCPTNFTTKATGSTECVPNCMPGYYWDSTKCAKCAKGTYQPLSYQYNCTDCLTGLTTENLGATSATQCIDICPSGFELQYNGSCKACEKNYYRTKGVQLQCVSCPGSSITFLEGADSIDKCYYVCDLGNFWNITSKRCEPCAIGSYQDILYQTSCKLCSQGRITVDVARTGPVTGATSESQCAGDCKPGTFWNSTSGRCEECNFGSYQRLPYRNRCALCTPGYTTDNKGSKTELDCYDPCQSGYTFNATSNKCEPCGLDYYRDRTVDNLCRKCPTALITTINNATSEADCKSRCIPGEEWDENLLVCKKCAIGSYQPDIFSRDCILCENGWITLAAGSTKQTDCKPPCLEGEEWNPTTKTCVPCKIGFYQDLKYQETCKSCGSGKSTQGIGSTQLTDCKSTTCLPGQFICLSGVGCANILDRCDGAPLNACPDGSDETGCSCTAGQYWDIALARCVDCARGSYQPLSGQFSCLNCRVGYTTLNAKSVSKTQCNEVCPDGQRFVAATSTCVVCALNTYRKSGRDDPSTCIQCPSPYVTRTTGAADITLCVPRCPLGQYYDPVPGSGCKPCALGYYQDEEYDQFSCKKCLPGKTTAATGTTSQAGCIEVCPLGYEMPIDGTTMADCKPCNKGFYRDPSITLCKRCPVGFTTKGNASAADTECYPECSSGQEITPLWDGCKPCNFGFYKVNPPTKDTPDCDPCPPGNTTLFPGATSPTLCLDLCRDGLELTADKSRCVACPKGTYRAQNSGKTECQSCPPGTTTEEIGSASIDKCLRDCKPGTYHNKTTNQCVPCNFGSYQNLPYKDSCIPCPTWKTTEFTGANDYRNCTDPCENGFESRNNRCEICPRGTYRQKNVQERCQACRAPFTTVAAGAALISQCVPPCAAGQRWDENSDSCVPCEEGSFNPNPYQLTCSACPADKPLSDDNFRACRARCHAGESWNRARQLCNWCLPGTYSVGNGAICTPCPAGTHSYIVGAVSLADCIAVNCPTGYVRLTATGPCQLCSGGQVPDATQTACVFCSSLGMVTTFNGLSCKFICPVGQYWNGRSCTPCAQHTYQDQTGQESCKSCPSDRPHTYTTGSTSNADCRSNWCSSGQIFVGGLCVRQCSGGQQLRSGSTTDCEPCPIGTSRPEGSLTTTCEPCNRFSYQDQTGQTSCKSCPPGEDAKGVGSTSIQDCRRDWCPGGQQLMAGSTTTCVPCPLGTYKPQGNDGQCIACDRLSYQDQTGQTSCKPCPAGEDTKAVGSTSIEDCRKDWCPGGRQLRAGSTTECEPCPAGSFKPEGQDGQCRLCDKTSYQDQTGQTGCKPCTPDGYHTMDPGSTSLSQCSADWCPAGRYYVEATESCIDCGFGKYRTIADVGCRNCPSGITYTTAGESVADCKSAACPAGSFINSTRKSCDLCPSHTYTASVNQLQCTPCPNGLHTSGPGAISADMCKENWCPGGLTFNAVAQTCVPCGFNKYRRFKMDTICLDCPSGLVTRTNTAADPSECVQPDNRGGAQCLPGYVLSGAVCVACPKGFYQEGLACLPCPLRYTTRRIGAASSIECLPALGYCDPVYDLVIAVDLSNSEYHDASHYVYVHLRPWLERMLGRLDIDPEHVRVGILGYADTVWEISDLDSGTYINRLCRRLDDHLKPDRSHGVNTGAALLRAHDMFARQGRYGVKEHLLLITDGPSHDIVRTLQTAQLLKNRNIHITVLGPDRLEVFKLATNVYSQFYIQDYADLPPDTEVVRRICRLV